MPVLLPTEEEIRQHLPPHLSHMSIEIYPSIDSTNTHARRQITTCGLPSPTLLLAHTQTAGRGRMGRQFYSPVGSGIYFSLVCTLDPHLMPYVTPTIAVATATAIGAFCRQQPLIKWVNDLYLDHKKVCGILVEALPDPHSGQNMVIIGVGVNVTTEAFPQGLRHPAGGILTTTTTTPDTAKTYDLSHLVADIVANFFFYIENPALCLDAYRQNFYLTGRTVTYAYVCTPDGGMPQTPPTVTGRVMGVDDHYNLQLLCQDGKILTLSSGEVTSVKA